MATTSIVKVPFRTEHIECIKDDHGEWVVLSRVCENLGIDPHTQRRKLKQAKWATGVIKTLVAADGKHRDVYCLHRKSVAMWLATIDCGRLPKLAREKIEAYQVECADVLDQYWSAGAAINPRATVPQLTAAQDRIQLYIAKNLQKYKTLWQTEVIEAISSLYRMAYKRGDRFPPGLWRVAGKIYNMVLSSDVANELRRLNPVHSKGRKHFQRLTVEARQLLLAELGFIRTMAAQSRNREELWARLGNRYENKPYQLHF